MKYFVHHPYMNKVHELLHGAESWRLQNTFGHVGSKRFVSTVNWKSKNNKACVGFWKYSGVLTRCMKKLDFWLMGES